MPQQVRVLVAEDEFILGRDLCNTVAEAGYFVEGPYDDLASAMQAYRNNRPDVAILDVQLGEGIVCPLAEQMMAENVPVIFHSGELGAIPTNGVASRFPDARTIPNPCPPNEMISKVQEAVRGD